MEWFFFNTSRLVFTIINIQKVSFIKTQKTGIFDILATVKWRHNTKQIDSPKIMGRLCEAVLYDDSGSILLTVWGDLIDSIEKCKTYKFHNLVLKNFFGLKLSTTTSTIITATSDADKVIPKLYESDLKEHEKMINDKLHPKLCCPELFGITVTVRPSCVNVSCTKHSKLFQVVG